MERMAASRTRRERRSPTPAAARKREAIRYVKAALQEGRFLLHYQPILTTAGARIAGVEALLRWRHPDAEHGALADLIRAAERSPLIVKLENRTLQEACQAAAAWRRTGLDLRVNVNVSASEFPRADLVTRLRSRLATAGLEATAVALEITETSRIDDLDAVAEQVHRLTDLGVLLWLDDFGTGHSSLEWLRHLPVHGLKIAGSFVERLPADNRCRAIVARVIQMAHDLGLRVAAEGVETGGQRDLLVEQGCDLLQGFLFYAPMPAEEVPARLAGARLL